MQWQKTYGNFNLDKPLFREFSVRVLIMLPGVVPPSSLNTILLANQVQKQIQLRLTIGDTSFSIAPSACLCCMSLCLYYCICLLLRCLLRLQLTMLVVLKNTPSFLTTKYSCFNSVSGQGNLLLRLGELCIE